MTAASFSQTPANADPQADESGAEAATLLLLGVLLAGVTLLALLVVAVRWSRRAVQRRHLSPAPPPPEGPTPTSLAAGPTPSGPRSPPSGVDAVSGDTRIEAQPGETLAD